MYSKKAIDIYRTLYAMKIEYIFSSAYRTFSRIDLMLGLKQVSINLKGLNHQSVLQPKGNLIRNQEQKEIWKMNRFMEIKQHINKQPMNH